MMHSHNDTGAVSGEGVYMWALIIHMSLNIITEHDLASPRCLTGCQSKRAHMVIIAKGTKWLSI